MPEVEAEYLEEKPPVPPTSSVALVVKPEKLVPLKPIMGLAAAKKRLDEFQSFVKDYLKENQDYGIIPGVKKPSLWKSGADKLCELYGLSDDYVEISKTIDWEKGLFDYELKCLLYRGDRLVGTGLGSCSSYEGKYRWRSSQRKCPICLKETIIKGKEEYGGGYICFGKKGGCGAKFTDTDARITDQVTGQTQNPDIADVKNTVLKMAKKRAKVDATIAVTRSSGLFTQDVEDTGTAPEDRHESTPSWGELSDTKPTAQARAEVSAISERDKKALFALMSRNNKTQEDLKKFLKNNYGLDSALSIPTYAYADTCLWAQQLGA